MREVLLPDIVVLEAVAGFRADVVDDELQVHLGFAAQTLDVRHEVSLIGADGAAQGVVIFKGGSEAERKDGGAVKATGHHASVIAGCGLRIRTDQACAILGEVLGDNDGEVSGRKQKDLVSKETRNP